MARRSGGTQEDRERRDSDYKESDLSHVDTAKGYGRNGIKRPSIRVSQKEISLAAQDAGDKS